MNTSFISPDTGKEYRIVPTVTKRNRWNKEGEMQVYTQMVYEIFNSDGNWVQFALDEESIPTSVKHHEFPGWDGIYHSPRD